MIAAEDYAWDRDTVAWAEVGWRVHQCLLEENWGKPADRRADLFRRICRATLGLHRGQVQK